ncbi:hypothetical protein IVA81_10925 [Bradyrhizobium sp. 141]|nr:hypothetical protein [Bradyrhizobium sp. 141]
MLFGRNREKTVERLVRPLPEAVEGVHHRSFRRPLKNWWRTFSSADWARYSICASSLGSTGTRLALEAAGQRFAVAYDSTPLFEVTGNACAEPGGVGYQGRRVTRFDLLTLTPLP